MGSRWLAGICQYFPVPFLHSSLGITESFRGLKTFFALSPPVHVNCAVALTSASQNCNSIIHLLVSRITFGTI